MSQNDKNNPVIPDMDFSALDGELAQMAAETPEVPTDFHAAWVKRVREEAAAQGAGKITNTKKESNRRQWRHLASVAAAFVLLIGGVILAWNQKNGGQPASGRTVNQQTQQTSEKAAENSSPDQEEQEQVSDEEINMASAEEPMEPGNEMEWAGEEDSVYIEDEAVGLAAVSAEDMAQAETEEVMEDMAAAESTAEEAKESGTGNGFFGRSDHGSENSENDGSTPETMTTNNPAPTTTASAATPAVPANGETTTAGENNSLTGESAKTQAAKKTQTGSVETAPAEETVEEHSFLQKVWTWILSVTPWALGGVVVILFIVSVVIRIGKKKS